MPALPAVPNVMSVQLQHTVGSDVDALVRLYFQYGGGAPSVTDITTFCTDVITAWNAHVKPQTIANIQLVAVKAIDLSSASGAEGISTTVSGGTLTGGPLSGSTCVLVGYKIGRKYRGGKPRSYVPSLGAAQLAFPQQWDATALGNFGAGWDAFINAIKAITAGTITISQHVNVSYYHGFTNYTKPSGRQASRPTPRGTPLVDNIIGYSFATSPGSQRRRNLH